MRFANNGTKTSTVAGLILTLAAGGVNGARGDDLDYAKHVAPVLQKYCVGCHNAEDAKGRLRLDGLDLLIKGGKRGSAIVPGKAAESLMVRMVDGKAKPRMPPKDNPRPTVAEWSLVKKWIDAGAKGSDAKSVASKPMAPTIRPKSPPKLSIAAVAASPRGNLLAVARYKSVELIELSTGVLRGKLEGHNGPVTAIVFNAAGSILVAAAGEPGQFGEVRIWEVAGRKLVRTIRGHRDSLYAAEVAPDGKILATAGYDKDIKLWDIATGNELRTMTGHNDAVYSLAFRPDGKIVASASGDRTVKLWDVATGKRLETFPQSTKELYAVVFSSTGDRVYAAGVDNRIRAWSVSATGKEGSNPIVFSRFAHQSPIVKLTMAPDGKTIASSAEDRTVKLWQADALTENRLLEPQPDWAAALAFSADNASLAVGRHDGTLALYDAKTGIKKSDVKPLSPSPADDSFFGNMPRILVDASAGSKVQSVSNLPFGVVGTIAQAGDNHRFTFEAKKGQTIVVDVQANATGSKLNAMVALFDAAGREVASSNDFDGQPDPLLAYQAPVDGKFTVQISDSQFTGGAEHKYRMAVGPFAMVTGVYPTSVQAGAPAAVELAGFNLPAGTKVQLTAGKSGMETVVPLDHNVFRSRREFKILALPGPVKAEIEPNDTIANATPLVAPGIAVGRIFSGDHSIAANPRTPALSTDVDYFRFHANAGSKWIIETEAARRGSPMDSKIEVLDAAGKPIERVLLQAVRDSNITFRQINSTNPDVRVRNWEEMELNEFMYFKGEVCKIFRLPQGPDSGFLFYNAGGQRLAYFDTSSVAHALGDDCYIVEPHAPGSMLIPNGLPTFSVTYANDDSADRKIGSDSRLTFTAPRDGDYLVKVVDVRGLSGDRFAYRLNVREPKPDFNVSLTGVSTDVSPGSGRSMTLAADRIDGFDGDISVEIVGLPKGFFASNPTVIQSGHAEAQSVLWTTKNAVNPTAMDWASVKIIAHADVEGSPVEKTVAVKGKQAVDRLTPPRARGKATKVASNLDKVRLGAAPKVTVKLEPAEVIVAPGTTVAATLSIERHGFDDRINFSVGNLPHGVYVDNIGLNGILIPKGQTKRQIYLTARKWVADLDRPFFAIANVDGNQASPPIVLKIRRPKELAKAQP